MLTSAYEIHLPLPYPVPPKIRRSIPFLLFYYLFLSPPKSDPPPSAPATPPCAWSSCSFWQVSSRTGSHLSSCLPLSFLAVVSVNAHMNLSVSIHSNMYPLLTSHKARRTYPTHPPVRRHPFASTFSSSPPPFSLSRSPQPRVIDHQKLKERLGSVVRSKEGSVSPSLLSFPSPFSNRKMVNVNAQFPFSLHPDSSSHSSRNVSGGTLPNSRAASPSPTRQLQKSPSTSSFRPEAEDALHYLPLVANSSAPILSIRLVKSARTTQSTRGRSQRSGDPNGRTQALDSELAPDEQYTPRARLPNPVVEEHSSTHVSLLSLPCLRDRHELCLLSPSKLPEAPPYPEDFDIHDAGAVARSWGD